MKLAHWKVAAVKKMSHPIRSKRALGRMTKLYLTCSQNQNKRTQLCSKPAHQLNAIFDRCSRMPCFGHTWSYSLQQSSSRKTPTAIGLTHSNVTEVVTCAILACNNCTCNQSFTYLSEQNRFNNKNRMT